MKNSLRVLHSVQPFPLRAAAKSFNRRREYLEDVLRSAPFDIIDHTGEYPQLLLTGIPLRNHKYKHVRTIGLFPLTPNEYIAQIRDENKIQAKSTSHGYFITYKFTPKKNSYELTILLGPSALDLIM